MSEPVAIVGIGAATTVGRGAWESAAAVRAGVSGYSRHRYMIDVSDEPVQVAVAPWLDDDLQGPDRFEALLRPAIEEAVDGIHRDGSALERWGLALALPAKRPGLPDDLTATLQMRFRHHAPIPFASGAVFDAGHSAGLLGLQAAMSSLCAGTLDVCLLAGVDSYMAPETLHWLEANDKLHGAGPRNNPWGFVPGEAGAAVLLMRESVAVRRKLPPLALVEGTGSAIETDRSETGQVCVGNGLTAAIRKAMTALPNAVTVTDIICDMNGEPHRADEYGFACIRNAERIRSWVKLVAPARSWGDVNSAGGVLNVVLAVIAGQKRYAAGNLALIFASGTGGDRGAALIRTVEP